MFLKYLFKGQGLLLRRGEVKIQPQVAATHFQFRPLGQAAQTADAHLVGHLAEHLGVALAAYLIKYHARVREAGAEPQEALQQGRHRVGRRTGIHDEYNGQIEDAGYLGRRAAVAVVAVEQPHHALHDGHIGVGRVAPEQFPQVPL